MSLSFNRNGVSGLLICAAGLGIAAYCAARYPMGTFNNVGPGMFPLIVGVFMAACGLAAAAVATISTAVEGPAIEWRPLVAVCAAVAAFALLVIPFGIIPAVFALTFMSALGRTTVNFVHQAILATGLAIAAIVIFKLTFHISVPSIAWPF